MAQTDPLNLLNNLRRPRLLVVGDLSLDAYTFAAAERVSPEAPVLLLRAEGQETRLGAAGGLAAMLRGLEAEVVLRGVVGDDDAGAKALSLLEKCGVNAGGVVVEPRRTTCRTERFFGTAASRHGHQILRVDHGADAPIQKETERRLIEGISEIVGRGLDSPQPPTPTLPRKGGGSGLCSAVLISDYGLGTCTPSLLRAVIDAARRANAPVLVDPFGCDYARYRGATLVMPNRSQAELASGMHIATADDAGAAGLKLCRDDGLSAVAVTLDADGICLARAGGGYEHFSTRPRSVYDVTGAGDAALAVLGVCVAENVALDDACRLANVAAGLEVEKIGAAPISRDEIRRDLMASAIGGSGKLVTLPQLLPIVNEHRAAGRRIVFTNGCFDLLHVGHVTYLQEAASRGDVLIVGLNSDASVRAIKGPSRPVIRQHDRAALLSALACVGHVVIFDADTPIDLIEAIRPDVLVKGGDYRGKLHEIAGKDFVESYGGEFYLAGLVDGVSTTKILRSLAA
ncbi:MAG: D-glycero-beta-D-manno-heptose 1-phosphate adenylyltransferase [Planctomycetia bacterium]|nr:D-glycero-beta-D-manno-heptose 1-phosphate adenylyltransferase [Planctomycetia bacterium]